MTPTELVTLRAALKRNGHDGQPLYMTSDTSFAGSDGAALTIEHTQVVNAIESVPTHY